MISFFTSDIVDSFAGGGGASEGIRRALGRSPDVCINHDPSAIAMHRLNHPESDHRLESVWRVDPLEVTRGRPVGLFWCSPDCRHFSRAKGAAPVSPRVRGLAWVAVHWAQKVAPRVIILENVREFKDWGPLIQKVDAAGKVVLDLHGNPVLIPDPTRKGQSFKRFVGRLRGLGYEVEWRELDAADFGAPTHRRRLFLVARRDGEGIAWPEPSHGPGRPSPYRTAAECIDWSLPCQSIFTRKKPLAENTMRRIAAGLHRYVIEAAEPFIVTCNHGGEGFRGQGLREPFCTVTKSRDAHGLVIPYVARIGHTGRKGKSANDTREPLTTITRKAEHLLVTPYLVGAGGSEYAGKPRRANRPMNVIKRDNHSALVSAFIVKHFGGQTGVEINTPLPTATVRATQNQVVCAFISNQNRADSGTGIKEPLRTICSNNHHAAEVRAFLIKYYGTSTAQDLKAPLDTVTSRARFGLVMVHGEAYQIVDIGMRMLTPRELARAQGFPDSYILPGTKTAQIAKIGNSVPPAIAEAVVRANCIARSARRAASA